VISAEALPQTDPTGELSAPQSLSCISGVILLREGNRRQRGRKGKKQGKEKWKSKG